MNSLKRYEEKILSVLKTDEAMKGITVFEEYPGTVKPHPVNKEYVTVGFKSAEIEKTTCGCLTDDDREKAIFAEGAELTVRISAYTPFNRGAGACRSVLERVVGAVCFSKIPWIKKAEMFEPKAERAIGAFTAYALLAADARIFSEGAAGIKTVIVTAGETE